MTFLMRVQSFKIECSLVFHNLYIANAMEYILFKTRVLGDHGKQPIYEFNWIIISIEIQLIKAANRMTKITTLFVCKWFQTTIFIQIESREIKWWQHFPIHSSSSSWLSILPHKHGGQKIKSLNCEMNSLCVISEQPTLRARFHNCFVWYVPLLLYYFIPDMEGISIS